ncbi:hypothetical protein INS49_014034 [Diaporthe citri]|uniref:uncharacterized protein n=1 Tax=Diaporthe citri TaxID=83186 RepID=UPI001C8075D7|nr:uncharacterized protein INS49_014034 [Diaporthe citri]KAG6358150.1 hypothetical protein INS49_014034 [Diaporthe citri]
MTTTNWMSKLVRVKEDDPNTSIFGRHHKSAFTYMDTEFQTVAQMATYVVAETIGNKSVVKEVVANPDIVAEKYSDMGLMMMRNHHSDDSDSVVFAVMLACVAKFHSKRSLFDGLVATGDHVIMDDTTNDCFWSIKHDDTDLSDAENWGENIMGRILMVVRFIFAGSDAPVPGSEMDSNIVTRLSMESAKVFQITCKSDWEGFVEEFEEEIRTKGQAT